MKKLVSTSNAVRLSFLLALCRDSGIRVTVFDTNISAVEAGISVFPRRIMVDDRYFDAAKRLLKQANEFYSD